MRKNQIAYSGLLVGSIILVSCHGGRISYALFYLCIGIPIMALAYIFYVYERLQFYQHTPSKIVEKGEILPYEVTFKNEDYIPFTHVKVNFYEEQCKIEDSNKVTEYHLLPGDEKKLETTLRCFYRGNYSVGVKEIEIMDFLYLFKWTYPVMWSLELTVLPKVIPLKHLSILAQHEDPKVQYTINRENLLLESDTRKYQPGDHPKQIHWKAVAHQGELLTRNTSSEVKRKHVVLMDCTAVKGDGYSKLAIEDKVIEIVLAISFYLQSTKAGITIGYENEGLKIHRILNDESFGVFYGLSNQIHFNGNWEIATVLEHYLMQHPELNAYLLVTHKLLEDLYQSVVRAMAYGQQVVVLYVAKEKSNQEEVMMHRLETIGAKVYWIRPEDSLEEVIG